MIYTDKTDRAGCNIVEKFNAATRTHCPTPACKIKVTDNQSATVLGIKAIIMVSRTDCGSILPIGRKKNGLGRPPRIGGGHKDGTGKGHATLKEHLVTRQQFLGINAGNGTPRRIDG